MGKNTSWPGSPSSPSREACRRISLSNTSITRTPCLAPEPSPGGAKGCNPGRQPGDHISERCESAPKGAKERLHGCFGVNIMLPLANLLLVALSVSSEPNAPVVLENAHLKYVVAADGRNLQFVDKATGTDYCQRDNGSGLARVQKAGGA